MSNAVPNKLAPKEDIEFILTKLTELVPDLNFRNENILLTGATGFFGKWLTQALIGMNDAWKLDNNFSILTRDRARTLEALPWLKGRPDFSLIEADVRAFKSEQKF